MNKVDLLNRIREQKGDSIVRAFKQLLEVWITDLRMKNDTAPPEEVQKHQGAIRELKIIIKQLDAPEKFEEKDGAYAL